MSAGLVDPEFYGGSLAPTGASDTTRTRTRVMLASRRLTSLMCARVTRWSFAGLPPHRAHALERLQEQFHEYRHVFGTAQSAGAVLSVLYPRGRGRPSHPVSFERALQTLGHRLVRLDGVLERASTGYVGVDNQLHQWGDT